MLEDVEEESEDVGEVLTKEHKLSMARRFPPEEGKLYAIYDLRILKNYDGSEQLRFSKELVEKSLEHHLTVFYRFYVEYGTFPTVHRILLRIHRQLFHSAYLRDLYDLFDSANTLTFEEPKKKSWGRFHQYP